VPPAAQSHGAAQHFNKSIDQTHCSLFLGLEGRRSDLLKVQSLPAYFV
jgi:hypothetical protein